MEIPVGTTLAYVLTELEIKHDGHFGEEPTSAPFTPLHLGVDILPPQLKPGTPCRPQSSC